MQGFVNAVGIALTLAPQACAAAESHARWERQVRELVRQLGDNSFARREAAYSALLRKGDRALPVLDRLRREEDPEIHRRLHRLRAALAWCKVTAVWETKLIKLRDSVNGGWLSFLSGRVTLLGPPRGIPVAPMGDLRILLYDHTPGAGNARPVLLETWIFPHEVLKPLWKQSKKATGTEAHVTLFLPWVASNRPEVSSVSLAVTFTPSEGAPADCRSAAFTVERTPPKPGKEPQGRRGITGASHSVR
jgi:hypothetical protein